MEDAHTCLLELSEDKEASFFAVFDGHGGHDVAKIASQSLHKAIVTNKAYRKQRIQEAITNGYLAFDHDIRTKNQHNQSGSTAISVLIRDNKIYCGNVGDSRAIASVAGEVELLSNDHKPNTHDEHLRIISAGGWVEFNRVNGNLALSRALGDFVYKRDSNRAQDEQIVIAKPEVMVKQLTADHEFIVLACDGIWDVMTNEEVVEFVRNAIAEGDLPDTICENLMTRCLAPDCRMGGVGCDNMTVIIVCLLHGQSYNELSSKCALTSTLATTSLVRERSVHDTLLEVDDDNDDEWYDCADDLLTVSASSNASNHSNHIETSTAVTQDGEEEMRVDDDDKAMNHKGEEVRQEGEESRQEDEQVNHEDIKQVTEETRQEEDLEQMETDTTTQAQLNNTELQEDTSMSCVGREDVNEDSLLISNSDHDNRSKDAISNKLHEQLFKSTAI